MHKQMRKHIGTRTKTENRKLIIRQIGILPNNTGETNEFNNSILLAHHVLHVSWKTNELSELVLLS